MIIENLSIFKKDRENIWQCQFFRVVIKPSKLSLRTTPTTTTQTFWWMHNTKEACEVEHDMLVPLDLHESKGERSSLFTNIDLQDRERQKPWCNLAGRGEGMS